MLNRAALKLFVAMFFAGFLWQLQSVARAPSWPPDVMTLTTPAAEGSAQPQLNVFGDRALLSWIERSDERATLKFAERTSSGWSPARTVSTGTDWFVNWADVPSVIGLGDHSFAAHWLEKSAAGPYSYDVRLAFSQDDGQTWSTPRSPHHDSTHTEHGFVSMFQAPGGSGLGLVWLDGRAMKELTQNDHQRMDLGAMSLRGGTFDVNGMQTSETLIDDRVCECCPTAAAVTSEGPIVAFRNRTEDEIRDIYVSRLVDGRWTEPTPIHRDNWKIAACPVNGPALSAIGRDVAVAWFTAVGDQGHVYAAFSSDAGKTFGTPVRVDDASAIGRVDIELVSGGSAIVSWIEFADARSQFRIRQVSRDGARSASAGVAAIPASRSSGYPRLARRGNELLFAWTDPQGQGSRVRTAVALVPVGPSQP